MTHHWRFRRRRGLRTIVLLVLLATALSGCGAASSMAPLVPGQNFSVVVDLDPLADLVRAVAGSRAEVISLVPSGLDGHTYEPRPSDVTTIARAHTFITNGGGLNLAVETLAERNLAKDASLVRLSELTVRGDELLYTDVHSHGDGPAHGHNGNVHLWTNPPYAMRYVDQIAVALSERDPEGAAAYAGNAATLNNRLQELSDAIATAVVTIPVETRKLVVYHDSWSYFGRNFGIEVIGAIQPADFSEPSAAEIRTMLEQIRDAGIPAFFGSGVFPSEVLQTVSRESGADYVADLNDDRLPGEAGDPDHTYIGMMVQNVRTMVDALGGDPSSLDAVDPAMTP